LEDAAGGLYLSCRMWIRQIIFGLLTSSSADFRASLKQRERYLTLSPVFKFGRSTSRRGMTADPIWECVISLARSCCTRWTWRKSAAYSIPFAGILGMRRGFGMREWVKQVVGCSRSFGRHWGGVGCIGIGTGIGIGQAQRSGRFFLKICFSVSVVCGVGFVGTCICEISLLPRFRPSRSTVSDRL